jgi:hypothetical protein
LDGSRKQTELVAFGITKDHPRGIGALAHVRVPRAQAQKPLELIGGGHAVGAQIKMQPILGHLVLRHGKHVDRWPRSIWWGDADAVVVLFDHLPAEHAAPELGDHAWLHGVDRDDRYSTGHATILTPVR